MSLRPPPPPPAPPASRSSSSWEEGGPPTAPSSGSGLPPLPVLPDDQSEGPSASGEARSSDPVAPRRVVSGLGCASCGGGLELEEGHTNLVCQYCDTPLAVVGRRGVVRLMVAEEIDREQAEEAVRRWFRSGIRKEPALRREAVIEELFLAWFPFVRARADIVGWLLGTEKRRRKKGDSWETVEEPVERQVERMVDRTLPAAEMAEFGVHRVDLRGDVLLPLDAERLKRRGMVFQPGVAVEAAANDALELEIAADRANAGLHRLTFSWLAAVRRLMTLVYYPFWVTRYSFRGRLYQVLIDAEDASVAYGKAPGNHLFRAACLIVACAAACFVGSTLLQHLRWLLRLDDGIAMLGAAGLFLVAVVGWGYTQFRHGGVVEEGSGVAEGRRPVSLFKTLRRVLD